MIIKNLMKSNPSYSSRSIRPICLINNDMIVLMSRYVIKMFKTIEFPPHLELYSLSIIHVDTPTSFFNV